METRYLGNSGLKVSVVGLGTNNFGGRMDQEATTEVVRRSIDLGITLFDTADIYGGSLSEQYLGKALGADRHDVIIATKFGMSMGEGPFTSGASRRYIMSAVEDSLRRLGTDYIDLYQVTNQVDGPISTSFRILSYSAHRPRFNYTVTLHRKFRKFCPFRGDQTILSGFFDLLAKGKIY